MEGHQLCNMTMRLIQVLPGCNGQPGFIHIEGRQSAEQVPPADGILRLSECICCCGRHSEGVLYQRQIVIGQFSKTGHVGVLGTNGTVQSESYLIEIAKFFPDIEVAQEACPEWVSLVEKNELQSPETDHFVELHINQILQKDNQIDTLLLACTHYPLLMDKIKQYTPEGIAIISQGEIVARSLKEYLQRHPEMDEKCGRSGQRDFFTTGDPNDFNSHASLFFGADIRAKKLVLG